MAGSSPFAILSLYLRVLLDVPGISFSSLPMGLLTVVLGPCILL